MTEESRPAEILQQYTTLEYILDSTTKPPTFVFVIDTAMIEEELKALKDAVLQAMMLLPMDAQIGLITFGRDVFIHELQFDECPKAHIFRGNKQVTTQRIIQGLGLKPAVPPHALNASAAAAASARAAQSGAERKEEKGGIDEIRKRFLLPMSECDLQVTKILQELVKDQWPIPAGQRQRRATGAAMSAAVSLLEALCKGQNARILTFVGGPCTEPPGNVVVMSLADPIRSHKDIQQGNAPLYQAATQFYTDLGTQAAANGHVIDLFAGSLDQVGFAEMVHSCTRTGGQVVLDDSFTHNVFTGSLRRLFATDPDDNNDLAIAFNAEMQVLTSKEIKITGALGNVVSLGRKSSHVSSNEVGIGGTCAWRLGALDHTATVGVYLEMTNQAPGKDDATTMPTPQQGYVQVATKYRHSSGRTHLRVSTIAKTFAHLSNPQGFGYIKAAFDQEAAAVLMTRWAIHRAESDHVTDVLRWLDRSLIKLVNKFATYTPNNPESFKLSNEFTYYPQFMFNLRRSQFLQVFNSSPDETAFFRRVCLRENTTNTLIMIQPTLTAYSLDSPPMAIALDVSAMDTKRILVLDTFFHVVVWYGMSIDTWRQYNVQERPNYEHFKAMLKAPIQDATALMERRFPTPRFIECVESGSQARFLVAKLNPSVTHANAEEGTAAPVFTEDVSLKVFLQHLRRLAVQEQ